MRLRGRWLLFLVLLIVSILLSLAGTLYFKSPFLSLFLFFPFLPFVFGGRRDVDAAAVKSCPVCDYQTTDPLASFCPRDASRLSGRSR